MKVLPGSVRKQIAEWRQMIAQELSADTEGGISEGNDVQVYFDGDSVYESMLQAIADARQFVHLEMYMFLSDEIGRTFARVLSDKAQQGIPVRVIFDSIGSADADVMQWARMRDAGVDVVEYRPAGFWTGLWGKRGGIIGRNHRKNLIVDGTIGFTGGMNIGNQWSRQYQNEDAWRDTQLSISGPAVMHLNQLFIDSWKHATDEVLSNPDPKVKPQGNCRCMLVGSQGLGSRKQIRQLFSVHLNGARKSVKMTMPYFVPPKRLRKSMQQAAQRGIDISVLVPRDSDVTIVDWLREGLYPNLLNWGVRVIEYLGPVLHAKTMIVDDNVAVIGSTNFDIISVLMNRETAVVIFDDDIAEELELQWENDLMLSERVTRNWEGLRPWWRLWLAKIGCLLIRRL